MLAIHTYLFIEYGANEQMTPATPEALLVRFRPLGDGKMMGDRYKERLAYGPPVYSPIPVKTR